MQVVLMKSVSMKSVSTFILKAFEVNVRVSIHPSCTLSPRLQPVPPPLSVRLPTQSVHIELVIIFPFY